MQLQLNKMESDGAGSNLRAESQYSSYLDIDLEELDDRLEELQYSLQAIEKYCTFNTDLFKIVSKINSFG